MKSRTSLFMTELLVMLLVFFIAAACCLKIFSWAEGKMTEAERKDEAVLQAQNLAERIKSAKGERVEFFAELENGMRIYVLPADSKTSGLGKAEIRVCETDGSLLYALPVCWQEDLP